MINMIIILKENVFKYFQIHDEKKSGLSKFVELKLYSKFKNNSKVFYRIFIDKLIALDDISILFELFPKEELEADFINVLLDKIPKVYQLGKNKDTNQLFENMFIIVSSIIKIFIQIYKCNRKIRLLGQ